MAINIQERAQKLYPGTIVELFILDLSELGGDILRFHSSINQGVESIFFDGNEYVPYPVEGEGWEVSGNSQLPRPKMRVSNIESNITALMLHYNGLRRAEVTRIRTFFEYTDGQPEADPTQVFPEDVFYISNKTNEDESQVEFELRAAADITGVMLPRGQVIAHACQWVYRGPECAYTLEVFYDRNENPLPTTNNGGLWSANVAYQNGTYVYVLVKGIRRYYVRTGPTIQGLNPSLDAGWTSDTCGKKLSSCKGRCGVQFDGVLNTSAFPGTFKLPS